MKKLTRRKNTFYGLFSGRMREELDKSVLSNKFGVSEYIRRQNLGKNTQPVDSEEIFQNTGLCI